MADERQATNGRRAARDGRPFFIVGAPRTGSTLLRRLLTRHPRIAIPPESGFLAEYLLAEHVSLAVRKELLLDDPELGYWELPDARQLLVNCGSMVEGVRRLHEGYAAAQDKDVWGQKTPKLVRCAMQLAALFPEAVFVHIVRDPRAVASSLKRSPAHRLHPWYGARRYVDDTRLGLALERAWPRRSLRVAYEEVVAQPEATLKRICALIGVAYDARLLDADAGSDLRLTPKERRYGHHTNIGKPVDAKHTERWRTQLSRGEIRLVEAVAAPLAATLGYVPEDLGRPGWRDRLGARCFHWRSAAARAWEELVERPDVWKIVRRRWRLGTLRQALGEHAAGR